MPNSSFISSDPSIDINIILFKTGLQNEWSCWLRQLRIIVNIITYKATWLIHSYCYLKWFRVKSWYKLHAKLYDAMKIMICTPVVEPGGFGAPEWGARVRQCSRPKVPAGESFQNPPRHQNPSKLRSLRVYPVDRDLWVP